MYQPGASFLFSPHSIQTSCCSGWEFFLFCPELQFYYHFKFKCMTHYHSQESTTSRKYASKQTFIKINITIHFSCSVFTPHVCDICGSFYCSLLGSSESFISPHIQCVCEFPYLTGNSWSSPLTKTTVSASSALSYLVTWQTTRILSPLVSIFKGLAGCCQQSVCNQGHTYVLQLFDENVCHILFSNKYTKEKTRHLCS